MPSETGMSVCGVYCDRECRAFGSDCTGCNELQGRVSWAKFLGKKVCPIFACVQAKGIDTCGDCSEVPCEIWLVETRNPSMTDEAYAEDLTNRMKNLGIEKVLI